MINSLLLTCVSVTIVSAMHSPHDTRTRFPTNMPTLVQHDQHMHPMLTSTDTASLVHQEAQSVSAMPANTNSSNSGLPSETKTMQQLALMLGRRGLERAAQSMQQHRAAVQHSSNSAYHSKLSWELLSSISWLPSWCQQHTTSKQPRQQPSAATHSWYAGDMYDDIQQEAMSFAQGQAAAVHGTKPTADSVSTRAPANLYAMQTPQLKTTHLSPVKTVTIKLASESGSAVEPTQKPSEAGRGSKDGDPVDPAVTMEHEADSSGRPAMTQQQTGWAQQLDDDYMDWPVRVEGIRQSGHGSETAGRPDTLENYRNDFWKGLTSAQSQAQYQAHRQRFQAAAAGASSQTEQQVHHKQQSNAFPSNVSGQARTGSGSDRSRPTNSVDNADDPVAALQKSKQEFADWLSSVHANPDHGQEWQPLGSAKAAPADSYSSIQHNQLQHASLEN